MKKLANGPLMVGVMLVTLALIPCQAWAEIRVGLAQTDITPPIGGTTAGYASAEPTVGVHDPLTARVMVLQSDDRCIAMAVCDLCVYNSDDLYDEMDSLGVDQLLLLNTHTHSGANTRDADFPSPDEPWTKTIDERIIEAIRQAKENMFVGHFAAGEGFVQLGYNRLIHRGKHSVTFFENPNRIPYGQVDPQVGVIRITDDQDTVRGVLINYACHPVVLGPRNRMISSDYPGVTRDVIEDAMGEACMCIFLQGAAGDINPLFMARGDDRDQDFEIVDAMGAALADEVKRTLALMEDATGKSDSFTYLSSRETFRHRFEPDQELDLGATTLLINDDIALTTMPGEPFHRFAKEFREKADVPHAYLLGYCGNGDYGWARYLPDLVSAARGGYGASDTTIAEVGAGERLLNQGLVQLFKMQGRLKDQPQRHTFDD